MDTQQAWPSCGQAAAFFARQFDSFAADNPGIGALSARLKNHAGVDILTLVDHWVLPDSADLTSHLQAWGFVEQDEDGGPAWTNPAARLPRVRLSAERTEPRLALAVDDVSLFLHVNDLATIGRAGDPDSAYEEAVIPLADGELAVVTRRGYRGFQPGRLSDGDRAALADVRTAYRQRRRDGSEDAVVAELQTLARRAVEALGQGRAVDEFFAAERDYYLSRNAAARWQYARQQELGIGWANHDHHTYRSSRAGFRALMHLWLAMGFLFRERFYAGAEAQWGAQILEHPVSRVVIFADVDMAPEELDIDFAADALRPRESLGTIGLWCALHGSSIAQAGMHHLECEFDFRPAQSGLEDAGFGVMPPFTDLPLLKQAFTQAEIWAVPPERIDDLREQALITPEQAERFRRAGAPGSHLEVLQRWEGFKGFNKTGVSAIIQETDARNIPATRA